MSVPHPTLVDSGGLARRLRELSDHELLSLRRDELRCLADDLESGTGVEAWAELDLVRSLAGPESLAPPDAPPGTGRPSRFPDRLRARPRPGASSAALTTGWGRLVRRPVPTDVIEAALGVLVFVPLLVTWLGLREATKAYGRLSAEDPGEASRPFLQLWQSGFGGRLSPLGRFDNVALMAVLLITLLVLVAGWHARSRARAERERDAEDAERERLLAALASVLTRTQLLLVRHRGCAPERFAGELTRAAVRLEALSGEALRGQAMLVRAAGSAESAATALGEAARRLAGELPALGTAAERIEDAVRAGSATLRGAQEASVRSTADSAAAVRDVGERIGLAGGLIEAALHELTATQRTLVTTSEGVVRSTDRASQALVTSTGRTGEAVDGMREAAERWDAAAAHWQDAAARLDAGIGRLADGSGPGTGPGTGPGSRRGSARVPGARSPLGTPAYGTPSHDGEGEGEGESLGAGPGRTRTYDGERASGGGPGNGGGPAYGDGGTHGREQVTGAGAQDVGGRDPGGAHVSGRGRPGGSAAQGSGSETGGRGGHGRAGRRSSAPPPVTPPSASPVPPPSRTSGQDRDRDPRRGADG